MARIIDGKALARELRAGLAADVEDTTRALKRPPGLGVILVGDDPGSQIYVRNKEKAALLAGLHSEVVRLPASVAQSDLEAQVDAMNQRDDIDAFLVQVPLPPHLDAARIVLRIDPDKDGDGLHPTNLGKLLTGVEAPRPCTPAGVMALLDEAGTELLGKRAVVVGRSAIVGKPVAFMLLERHATVTVCHSRTADLAAELAAADVVVAALGKPRFIQGAWLKPGATVIDVGTSRVDERVVGDVDFETAEKRVGAITPVPGGVGPMTIAMLLGNAVRAARRKLG